MDGDRCRSHEAQVPLARPGRGALFFLPSPLLQKNIPAGFGQQQMGHMLPKTKAGKGWSGEGGWRKGRECLHFQTFSTLPVPSRFHVSTNYTEVARKITSVRSQLELLSHLRKALNRAFLPSLPSACTIRNLSLPTPQPLIQPV